MSKARPTFLIAALLFLRWLATDHRASRGPLHESAARALDRTMAARLTEGWCES